MMMVSTPLLLTLSFIVLTASALSVQDPFKDRGRRSSKLFSDPRATARLVHPSVVLVTPIGVRNMTARGSGFAVEYNEKNCTYIVTAAHVAAPGFELEVSLEESRRSATVVARNLTLDLALIRTEPFENIQCLAIASETPEVGTLGFAHGFSASRMRGPAMTSGIVCGIADGLGLPNDEKTDETTFIVTDAAMSGGMSGGPLTNVGGVVIGVNALIRPDLRALGNYAVSANEIRSFLARAAAAADDDDDDDDDIRGYRVLLFNDPMNKKERVANVLRNVAVMEESDANKVMMEAHKTGRAVVRESLCRPEADELCNALRKKDILVEVDQA